MLRSLRIVLAALLGAAVLVVLAPQAEAAGYRLNPANNVAPPSFVYAGACHSAPAGSGCSSLLVRALNAARAKSGQPAYDLPSRFKSLTPAERLLVLVNQDRALYDRVQVFALNATLDTRAQQGAEQGSDPDIVSPVSGYSALGGGSTLAIGSGPMANPLFAYYLWMWDDGYGGPNGDCRHAGDPGCWGHRDVTLTGFGPDNRVLLGVGATTQNGYSYWTELFESFRGSATVPMIPTITGLSQHVGPERGATSVLIAGFGLFRADAVGVLTARAQITTRHNTSLRIVTPVHVQGYGYVVVHTNGGTSHHTTAAAWRYVPA